ncbi:MAG: lytic transglycosylase domain-containing protein [Armatimonadota bacterium]
MNNIQDRINTVQQRIADIQAQLARVDRLSGARTPDFQAMVDGHRRTRMTPDELRPLINQAAERYGIRPELLEALIQQESGFDPDIVSKAGAQGLTQLMPGTAAGLGVTDPFDPEQNVMGGARYLRMQLDRFNNDERLALAAYNAGPGAVQRYHGIPPYAETRNYVRSVLSLAGKGE